MDLTHLGRRLQVTDTRCIDKAKEYARLARCKQGVGNSKQWSVEAQSVACIDLACKLYSQTVDSSLLVKYSLCRTPAAYAKVLSAIQATLGLTNVVTTKELAIQYGCIQANDLARKVLRAYKEKMREAYQQNAPNSVSTSVPSSSSSSAPPYDPRAVTASSLLDSRNVYPCVAFYLSCKHLSIVGVDRKRLLSTAAVKDKEFNHVMESFCAVIPELAPTKSPTKKPKNVKPKKDAAAEEQGDKEDSGEPKAKQGKRKRAGRAKQQDESDVDDYDDDGDGDEAGLNEDDYGEDDDDNASANDESQQRKKAKNSDDAESESNLAAASSFLKQAKLNFSDSKQQQLRVEDEDEGEAQLSN